MKMHLCSVINPDRITPFIAVVHQPSPGTWHPVHEPYFQFTLFSLTWRLWIILSDTEQHILVNADKNPGETLLFIEICL
jgi:hypothetical protein